VDRLLAATISPVDPNLSDPAAWITQNFYIPETNAPITLAPYQDAALREALRRDGDRFVYSTIVWSDLKKSAKTTIAAGVMAWMAHRQTRATIRLVGNDMKQADSRVFNALTSAIELNPKWRGAVKVIQHKITFPNGSVIESVPVDPRGEAGGNDDAIEWTELWAAQHSAHQKMWNELTLSPTKFGQSFRWTDTYAGYSGESEILENLYDLGVKQGEHLDLSYDGNDLKDLEVYARDRLFVLWNTRPRLGWLSEDYYKQESSTLSPSEFERMHRNQWITSSQTFVPAEWWAACKVTNPRPIDPREPMVIALDAAVSGDCFAMLGVTRRDTESKPTIEVRFARAWKPPKNGSFDYDDEIEPELRRLIAQYNVVLVCYDPYQLHQFATRLAREQRANFSEFNQGVDRLIADKQLQDLIRERRIEHSGEPELTEHVMNANAKSEGEKLRIVKRNEAMKIDLCVALSMASDRILRMW
jgi:phage terminase large subunit-like protein